VTAAFQRPICPDFRHDLRGDDDHRRSMVISADSVENKAMDTKDQLNWSVKRRLLSRENWGSLQ